MYCKHYILSLINMFPSEDALNGLFAVLAFQRHITFPTFIKKLNFSLLDFDKW